MRLDIAVSILAQTSLTLVAESSLLNADRKRKKPLLRQHSSGPHASPLHDAKPELRNVEQNVVIQQGKKPKATSANTKTYSRTNTAECNPRSNKPDIGIFSCGTDRHCIQDDESTLGGFCIALKEAQADAMHRSLQDGGLCNDSDCDCSKFENGVGTYVCASSECVDESNTICGRKENVVIVNSDGSYRTSTCFVDTDGSPIESYCYSTIFDGLRKTDCELEYNGEMCNSCSHVICSDKNGGGLGLAFDCSNVSADKSARGSTCEGDDWKDFFLNPEGVTG
jgi:hypothetical protein